MLCALVYVAVELRRAMQQCDGRTEGSECVDEMSWYVDAAVVWWIASSWTVPCTHFVTADVSPESATNKRVRRATPLHGLCAGLLPRAGDLAVGNG